MTERLYAYIDESGQDTAGRFFVVCVVIVGQDQETITQQLEAIEARSGKHTRKWQRTRQPIRQAYIDELFNLSSLTGSLFFSTFLSTRRYTAATAEAAAQSILARAQTAYKITVFVDGLRKTERQAFTRELRALHIRPHKVRGVLQEKNNALIRLADAMCGLVRDEEDASPWAVTALADLERRGLLRGL